MGGSDLSEVVREFVRADTSRSCNRSYVRLRTHGHVVQLIEGREHWRFGKHTATSGLHLLGTPPCARLAIGIRSVFEET